MAGNTGERTLETRRWRDIEEIPLDIWNSLTSLPRGDLATRWGFYPASAVLRNGVDIKCVAFVEKGSEAQSQFYSQVGFLRRTYEFDSSRMIDVGSVASVSASPYATPLGIQAKMAKIEAGLRKVTLKDGRAYLLDSRTDEFINLPRGYQAKDIIDVTAASEEDLKSFPRLEFRIWGDTSDYSSLGLMYVLSEYSQQWEIVGYDDRAMLCFFKRPRASRHEKGP